MANFLSELRANLSKLVTEKAKLFFCVYEDTKGEDEIPCRTLLGIFTQEGEALEFLVSRGRIPSEMEPLSCGQPITKSERQVCVIRESAYDLARYLEANLVTSR